MASLTSSSVPTKYIINGTELEKVEIIIDLGVCYDSYLLFNKHINDKIAKAYGMLGLINRSLCSGIVSFYYTNLW